MAVPTGVIMPPPTPCRKRKAISWPMLCARPHSAEPLTNIAMREQKGALGAEAVADQARGRDQQRQAEQVAGDHPLQRRGRAWNSRPSVGSATLTTVVSSRSMKSRRRRRWRRAIYRGRI